MIEYVVMACEVDGPGVRLFAADTEDVADILGSLLCNMAKVGGKEIQCVAVPVHEFCKEEIDEWIEEMIEEAIQREKAAGTPAPDLFPRNAYTR